jgi:AcrR family transcriptional regulator
MRKTDPRYIRTEKMLRDALIATILEKGYDATLIQDITDRAGLRRATFYLHYRDKEELLLEMMRETVDELMAQTQISSDTILLPDAQRTSDYETFTYVQERADLYRAVLRGQRATQIINGIRDYMAECIRESCMKQQPQVDLPLPIEVVANYMAAVKLNMIIWWLENGMPYPAPKMAEMCSQLLLGGMASVLSSVAPSA